MDSLVGLTIEIALDQDCWRLELEGLTDYAESLWGLWLSFTHVEFQIFSDS